MWRYAGSEGPSSFTCGACAKMVCDRRCLVSALCALDARRGRWTSTLQWRSRLEPILRLALTLHSSTPAIVAVALSTSSSVNTSGGASRTTVSR